MRIKVLGCDGGIGDPLRTCAVLLDDDVLIDAGTGVGDLPLSALRAIDHVFLTHAHCDHIASLPLLVDAVMPTRQTPVTVYATADTVQALRDNVFNWSVWPDFTQLPALDRPVIRYSPVQVGETIRLGDRSITPVPARHSIPTVGFEINGRLVYCGDTTVCDELWDVVNRFDDLQYLIIETAFDDARIGLAEVTCHLCPTLLAAELEKLQRPAAVYIAHMKPGLGDAIMGQIGKTVRRAKPQRLERGHVLEL